MKIRHVQAVYIMGWKKPHRFAKYCGTWELTKINNSCYKLRCNIKWPVYLALIIPVTIIEALYSMWDGGLRYYSPADREVCSCVIDYCNPEKLDWARNIMG